MFSVHTLIMALVAIFVVCLVAAIWLYANSKGHHSRGRRRVNQPQRSRSTDKRHLTPQEKKLFAQAQILLQEGKVLPAARILEQIKMPREAIQALEDHGEIHEAATILMRMQRHNRAGVVYARHGMWPDAAKSFLVAKMPLEAAKCYREAGDFGNAAQYFESAQRLADAADCYEKKGDFHHAARLLLQADNVDGAVRLYKHLTKTSSNLAAIDLAKDELDFLVNRLSQGHADLELADLIAHRNRLTEVLHGMLTKGLVDQAVHVYKRSKTDIGPQLISEVNYADKSAASMASMFSQVADHRYAGMVFERMEDFDKAADAFEKASDFDRAIYCYERSGKKAKVRALRDMLRAMPASGTATIPQQDSPFALKDVEDTALGSFAFGSDDREEEKTEMLSSPAAEEDDNAQSQADTSDEIPETRAASEADESHPIPIASKRAEGTHKAFHRVRFFSDLDFDQRNALWDIGESFSFDEGDTILDFHDDPVGIYVIVKGQVEVYRAVGDEEKYVDRMRESETFGELWLLADQPSAVKFVAAAPVEVRAIAREPFNALMDKDGSLARKLYKRFTTRLLRRLLSGQNEKKKSQAS